jgi:hypothetical protein
MFFKHYLTIAAIVKNEAQYIAEWIEYHLLVGVEKFYIYDNDSTDNLKEILKPYIEDGIVEYIYFPSAGIAKNTYVNKSEEEKQRIWWCKKVQLKMCEDAVLRYKNESYWMAFIDIDEFIVPLSTDTIPDFLKNFEDVYSVEINWLNYGSSGKIKQGNEPVIERFKDHSNYEYIHNRGTKTIINPRAIVKLYVHNARVIDFNKRVDVHKNRIEKNFLKRQPIHDTMRINHYRTKSMEECFARPNRGFYPNMPKIEYDKLVTQFDKEQKELNMIKNDATMDKYIPLLKEKLKQRKQNQ